MSRSNGERGVIKYDDFAIADAQKKYKVSKPLIRHIKYLHHSVQIVKANGFHDDSCGTQVGNSLLGDDFGSEGFTIYDRERTVHVGMKFSTYDKDNDNAFEFK